MRSLNALFHIAAANSAVEPTELQNLQTEASNSYDTVRMCKLSDSDAGDLPVAKTLKEKAKAIDNKWYVRLGIMLFLPMFVAVFRDFNPISLLSKGKGLQFEEEQEDEDEQMLRDVLMIMKARNRR